jgi:hypothetical protein
VPTTKLAEMNLFLGGFVWLLQGRMFLSKYFLNEEKNNYVNYHGFNNRHG